jgi:large subunit ribosomal protein L21
MYAIVKTGGKQYRVEPGEWLRVERLPVEEGETVTLQTLLYVDGDQLLDGEELSEVSVTARVLAHERGPKLRVVKFKPKRGYRRRTGHRQDLTRIRIESIEHGGSGGSRREAGEKSGGSRRGASPKPVGAPRATAAATAAAPEAPEVAPEAPEAAPESGAVPPEAQVSDGS